MKGAGRAVSDTFQHGGLSAPPLAKGSAPEVLTATELSNSYGRGGNRTPYAVPFLAPALPVSYTGQVGREGIEPPTLASSAPRSTDELPPRDVH